MPKKAPPEIIVKWPDGYFDRPEAKEAIAELIDELAKKWVREQGRQSSAVSPLLAKAIKEFEEDEKWVQPLVDGCKFHATSRNRFASALLAQAHEHTISIRLLLAMPGPGNRFGTAAALMRPILEGLVRALWILDCATEEQLLERIENDDIAWRPGLKTMASAVDRACATGGFYRTICDRFYDAMCSFTHGGMRVVSKNLSAELVEPRSTELDWFAVVNFAHSMDLLTAHGQLSIAGQEEDAQRCLHRAAQVACTSLTDVQPFQAS